jgi:hypothetical protein
MALQPHQLLQLRSDVLRVYREFVTVYGGDTGSSVNGGPIWVASDSGFLAAGAIEATRLKVFADAHLTAHASDGRARDIFIELHAMGRASTSVVDTGH